MSRHQLDAEIERLTKEGRSEGDHGEVVDIRRFAIRAECGAILEATARTLAPCGVVEVGCASGLSTLYLLRGLLAGSPSADRVFHVVDPKQTSHWKNIGRHALNRAGQAERVTFHEGYAHDVLPDLLRREQRIGLAFIDGWHMLDFVMVEAFYCDIMLDVGGVIILHDMWMPGLQHFASFWAANRPYEPVMAGDAGLSTQPLKPPPGDYQIHNAYFAANLLPFVYESMLILRKTGSDQRPWDAFTDFTSG